MLHLIPDCTGDMEDAFESANVKSDYPVSVMLIAVGFFIVTLVEIFVIKCQKSRVTPSEVPDHTPGSITGHGHSHSQAAKTPQMVFCFAFLLVSCFQSEVRWVS